MKARYLIPIVMILIVLVTVIPPGHANQTIFYQDFTGTTFPTTASIFNGTEPGCPTNFCTGVTLGNKNASAKPGSLVPPYPKQYQIVAGWIDMWVTGPESLGTGPPIQPQVGVEFNMTSPVVSASTGQGSLTVITFRLIAFNATNGQAPASAVSASFGLMDRYSGFHDSTQSHRIYFSADMETAVGSIPASYGITAGVEFPEGTPASGGHPLCPEIVQTFLGVSQGPQTGPCVGHDGGPLYSTQIDLSQIHTYQIAYMNHRSTNSSWAAFSIDSMGWMNVTQQECNCFGAGASIPNLFPFINLATTSVNFNPPGSIGIFLNYVLVTDYVPVGNQIPAGNLLPYIGPPIPPSCSSGYSDVTHEIQCGATDIGGGVGNCFNAGTTKICFGTVIGGLLMMFGLLFFLGIGMYLAGMREPLLYGAMTITVMIILFVTGVLPTWFIYMIAGTVIAEFAGVFPRIGLLKRDTDGESG